MVMNITLVILAVLVIGLSINPTHVLEQTDGKQAVAEMQEGNRGSVIVKRLLDRDTSSQTLNVVLSDAGRNLHARHNLQ